MRSLVRRLDVRGSYGKKFVFLLGVVFLLTGVAGASIYVTVDDRLTEETERQLTATADGNADQVGDWFALTEQQLTQVSRTTAVRSGDEFQISDRLVRISNREAIAGTHLVDASTGEVAVSTGETAVVEDGRLRAGAHERLTAALDRSSERVVTSSAFRRSDGTPAMLVAAETPTDDGQAIVAVVDLATLSEHLFGGAHGEGTASTVSVVDERGTVVLSSDPDRLLREDPVGAEIEAAGTGFRTDEAADAAVGYAAIPDSPWLVTNRVPAAEAYALRDAVSERILVLLSVLLLGLGLVAATVGRNTVATVTDLAAHADRLREGDLRTPVESDRRDEFGAVYETMDEMRRSLAANLDEAESARDRAEASRRRTEAINDRLRERAAAFGEVMDAAADGDLTVRLDESADNEAMRAVAAAANRMLADLERAVAEIDAFVGEVDRSSDGIAESAREVERASESVSDSVQEISAATRRQHENVERANAELATLSAAIEEVASSADRVAEQSSAAAEAGERGRERADAALSEMDAIEAQTAETVDEVEGLAEEVDRIGETADRIEEIAEQTNMLALNAEIEAARSGGGDRSFGPVAEEVKELAEETADAAEEIAATAEAVRDSTDAAVEDIRETDERIAEGRAAVRAMVDALEEIADAVEAADEGVQSISAATDDQAASTEEVVSMMDEVADQGERTTAEAQHVAAAAQQQTSSIASVTDEIDALSERAGELRSLLDAFDVRADGDRVTGTAERTPDLASDD